VKQTRGREDKETRRQEAGRERKTVQKSDNYQDAQCAKNKNGFPLLEKIRQTWSMDSGESQILKLTDTDNFRKIFDKNEIAL
jgi:hypothetical protein